MGNAFETSVARVLAHVTTRYAVVSYEDDLCLAGVVRGEFGITALFVRTEVIPAMVKRGLLTEGFDALNCRVFTPGNKAPEREGR